MNLRDAPGQRADSAPAGSGVQAANGLPAESGVPARIPTPPSADAPLVLLVDDREDKLIALESVLRGLDLSLVAVRSGKDALRQLLVHDFAVILLDVNMPVMDGFETASLIRQRAASEHTPIIFITGNNVTETHVTRGYQLGAVDYIFTPVMPEVLRAKVAAFIELYRRNHDIQRRSEALRDEAERRAAGLESRLATLLNRLNVGVFRRRIDGRLVAANPTLYRILGMNQTVDPGHIDISRLALDPPAYAEMQRRLQRDGQVQEHPVRCRRLDGRAIWISISKTIVHEPDGTIYVDGLVEDITSRREAEEALAAKADELARSNAELEQFAYVASHDLQEPLRMVSLYSSLLRSRYAGNFDERGCHLLDQVVEGATRMQQMIHDILSYARLDRPTDFAAVDCEEVASRALTDLQGLIGEAGAQITRDPLPRVVGDPVQLAQVFQNLIANAVKFRRPGSAPHIHLGARRDGERWWLTVRDDGIGIAPQHQEQIFRVFQRLHTRDEYEGSGIGLAVCRKIVARHGGELKVESTGSDGSTFSFSVQAANAEAEASAAR